MENYKVPRTASPQVNASVYARNQFDSALAANELDDIDELQGTVTDVDTYASRMATGYAPEYGAHELDCEFSDRDSFGSSALAGDLHGEEFHDGMFSIFHDADDDDGLWDTSSWDDEGDAGALDM